MCILTLMPALLQSMMKLDSKHWLGIFCQMSSHHNKNKKTEIREDKSVTNAQRSTINSILRKNLGDSKAAYYILNHGLPTLLDLPLRRRTDNTKAQLQNMLEELMMWPAALLQSLIERQEHPDMAVARKLSALDQKDWQRRRRQRKSEAMVALRQDQRLSAARDRGKNKFEDMSATQQQVV